MEKRERPENETSDTFEPPPVVTGPLGADEFTAAQFVVGQPSPVPPRTPEHFVCLRGPCRHYWHLVTMVDAGNPEETWKHLGIKAPRQHYHTCLLNPGMETSFGDDNAYECNRWDPIPRAELAELRAHRDAYYAEHPDHRPIEEGNFDDVEIDDEQ